MTKQVDRQFILTPPDQRALCQTVQRLNGKRFRWAYLGQSIVEFLRAKKNFDNWGQYIDTADDFQRTGEELRSEYLTFLYSIGQEINTLKWWITSLAHRNGAIDKTFHRACYLKVALGLIVNCGDLGPLVLVTDHTTARAIQANISKKTEPTIHLQGYPRTSWLTRYSNAIKMGAHRTYYIFRESYRVFQAKMFAPPIQFTEESTTLIFAWITPENLKHGQDFHKYYYGDLANKLDLHGERVAIVPIILREVPYHQTLSLMRGTRLPTLVPHSFVGIWELLRAVIYSSSKIPLPTALPRLSDMDVSRLVEEDLTQHWIGNGAADALLMSAMVRTWAKQRVPIRRIIYIFENQPYERALIHQMRRSYPDVTLVAYQHVGVAPMRLQVQMAPGGEPEAPQPDFTFTIGDHNARLLLANGHCQERVKLSGALQMEGLSRLRAHSRDALPQYEVQILIALSFNLEEAAELAEMATTLYEPGSSAKIILKCHPVLPFQKISEDTGIQLPKNVQISEEPLIELMQRCSLMVYTSTTSCIQALALGIPVVHFKTHFGFDLDPLASAPHLRLEASDLPGLRLQVDWLLEHGSEYAKNNRGQWNEFVDDMYGPVDEESYLAFSRPVKTRETDRDKSAEPKS